MADTKIADHSTCADSSMTIKTSGAMPIAQVPVGELLRREIEARGWSQGGFAAVLDRPTQFVSEGRHRQEGDH